jgi:hypothetical protein
MSLLTSLRHFAWELLGQPVSPEPGRAQDEALRLVSIEAPGIYQQLCLPGFVDEPAMQLLQPIPDLAEPDAAPLHDIVAIATSLVNDLHADLAADLYNAPTVEHDSYSNMPDSSWFGGSDSFTSGFGWDW